MGGSMPPGPGTGDPVADAAAVSTEGQGRLVGVMGSARIQPGDPRYHRRAPRERAAGSRSRPARRSAGGRQRRHRRSHRGPPGAGRATRMTARNRLVGMIQFPGFPHDPGGMASVAAVVDRCARDADVLLEAGFRTLMVQNLATGSPWRHETTAETASLAPLLVRLVER